MIHGTMILTDTIMTHTCGITDGAWDFLTVIRTGALVSLTDILTITLHGILRGTLPGIIIHTGEGQGMDITAVITAITMDVPIVTFTDLKGEYIMEEVIHFQAAAEAAEQYQALGLQGSRESHAM